MTRSGIAFRLKPLAPLTGATASGSSGIPTPTAGDAKSSGSRNLPGSGAALGVSLTDYVRPDRLERFKWPTPHGMPKDGQARNPGPSGNELGRAVNLAETWPTPTAQDAANDGGPAQLNRNSLPLNAAVKAETPPAETEQAESPQQRLWPTPRPGSSGGHGGGSEFGTYRRTPSQKAGKHGLYLQAEVIEEEIANGRLSADDLPKPGKPTGGSLNPTWVEWLMGFPPGWTVCEHWETRSSRRSRSGSASRSSPTKRRTEVVVAEARRLSFRVVGKPEPRGSKNAFRTKTGATVVTDSNPHSGPWMGVVADAALNAMIGEDGTVAAVMEGPLAMAVVFTVARPKGHYGTGRNEGVVKASAPSHPAVKPDTTKLLRGLEDALSGVVWRDDAQVVEQTVAKRYGHPEGAQVIVWTL
jgi:Holliday junction resolvase RusA-like endonuclease